MKRIKRQIRQLLKKAEFWSVVYKINSKQELIDKAVAIQDRSNVVNYLETRLAIITQLLMTPSKTDDFNKGRVFELLEMRSNLLNVIRAEQSKKK